jgi:IS605 OrfB family transposase
MKLVERHYIKPTNKFYKEIDNLSFLSKNLYNSALYICRQAIFNEQSIPNFNQLYHLLKDSNDYKALPTKVSQLVIKQVDRTFKSYYAALKAYKKNPNKFKGLPKLPRYKDKLRGRNIVTYNYQAVSKKKLKQGIVNLSKTLISIPTKVSNLLEVRLIPKVIGYIVEIVYEKEETPLIESNYSAYIDLGLNNLATLTSNKKGFNPKLICGRAIKSCNHFYNKRVSQLKSLLPKEQKTSKRIKTITNKRNNKVDYYLHTASKYIIDSLLDNQISLLVIGNNKDWKQNINIGKRNNQNFVGVPHSRLIQQLEYKAKLVGINVVTTEESYTSKCSFMDLEPIKKHKTYQGIRTTRGLFKSSKGYIYSADVNGSLNIGRKVVGDLPFSKDSIESFVVKPLRVKPYKAN